MKIELKQLSSLKANNALIEALDGKGKNLYDFLTKKDKTMARMVSIGRILCTMAGLMTFSGILLAASGATMGVSIAVFAAIVIAVSIYYFFEHQQQFKELGEQRKKQLNTQITYRKNLIALEHDNTLVNAHHLLQEYDPDDYVNFKHSLQPIDLFAKDKSKLLAKKAEIEQLKIVFTGKTDKQKNNYLLAATIDGDLRLVKRLVYLGATIKLAKAKPSTTALHAAVEQGNLLVVEEMLGVSIAATMRKNKQDWRYDSEDKDIQRELKEKQEQKLNNYKQLHQEAKALLLTYDAKGKLPLDYAAALQDPTLYYLLQKQVVGYSKEQLEKASQIRKQVREMDQIGAIVHAIFEALCPASSVGESIGSFAFVGLTVGAGLGLGLAVSITSLAVFGFVIYGNYYKNRIEHGILEETEQLAIDNAFARNIEFRLDQLANQKEPLTAAEIEELKGIKDFINTPRPLRYEGKKTKASDFIHFSEKVQVLATSVGAFFCAYAGVLGLISLGFTLYAAGQAALAVGLVSAVAATGPVGLGLLIGGALLGLAIAAAFTYYYYHRRESELKVFGENRQSLYIKENALAMTVNNLAKNSKLLNMLDLLIPEPKQAERLPINTSQLALQRLNNHGDCSLTTAPLPRENNTNPQSIPLEDDLNSSSRLVTTPQTSSLSII